MEISALFAPVSLDAARLLPIADGAATPGSDAFAAIFAALVGESAPTLDPISEIPAVETPNVQSSEMGTKAEESIVPILPTGLDRVEPSRENAAPPSIPDREKSEPQTSTPEKTVVQEPFPEDVPQGEPPENSPPTTRRRPPPLEGAPGGGRIIPDPPPDANPVTSEKEAPTKAPNAPVPPLDRSSEIDETPEREAQLPDTPVCPVAATAAGGFVPSTPPVCPVATTSPGPVSKTGTNTKPASRPAEIAPVVPRDIAVPVSPIERAPLPEAVESSLPDAPVVLQAETPGFEAAPDLGIETPIARVLDARTLPALTEAPIAPEKRSMEKPSPETPLPERPVVTDVATPKLPSFPSATSPESKPVAAAPKVMPTAAKVEAQPIPETAMPSVIDPIDSKATDEPAAVESIAVATEAPRSDAETNDDAPPDDAPNPQPATPANARTVATQKPEAGADRPAIDRHLVVRQVAERIENLVAARPKDGVTIHLEPRDLGTITLVVKGLASALDVQVAASDERVQKGLDVSRPELAQALAPRGIELRELKVAYAPTPSGGASSSGDHPQRGPNPEDRPRPQSPVAYPSSSRKATPTSRRASRGVEIFV